MRRFFSPPEWICFESIICVWTINNVRAIPWTATKHNSYRRWDWIICCGLFLKFLRSRGGFETLTNRCAIDLTKPRRVTPSDLVCVCLKIEISNFRLWNDVQIPPPKFRFSFEGGVSVTNSCDPHAKINLCFRMRFSFLKIPCKMENILYCGMGELFWMLSRLVSQLVFRSMIILICIGFQNIVSWYIYEVRQQPVGEKATENGLFFR